MCKCRPLFLGDIESEPSGSIKSTVNDDCGRGAVQCQSDRLGKCAVRAYSTRLSHIFESMRNRNQKV